MTITLPVHATPSKVRLESAFAARVLGKREAARLCALADDAHRQATADLAMAMHAAQQKIDAAHAEAMAILAMLPGFAAFEAAPAKKGKSALAAVREVADRYGLPIAAVTGKGRDDRIKAVRREAIRAVADACPRLTDTEIGALFSGLPAATVHRYRRDDVG